MSKISCQLTEKNRVFGCELSSFVMSPALNLPRAYRVSQHILAKKQYLSFKSVITEAVSKYNSFVRSKVVSPYCILESGKYLRICEVRKELKKRTINVLPSNQNSLILALDVCQKSEGVGRVLFTLLGKNTVEPFKLLKMLKREG